MKRFLNRFKTLMPIMVQFKIVIADPKEGKSKQKELSEEESVVLMNKKIGESISGDALGFVGYEFKITGGSDNAGMPMRSDNPGIARKRILAVSGIGIKNKGRSGAKRRKLVAGNTVSDSTAQVNMIVTKAGKESLFAQAKDDTENADTSNEKETAKAE